MAITEPTTRFAAHDLAGELPYLRPSQQRKLSRELDTPGQMSVLAEALRLVLENVPSVNDETIERLFLFGVEIRQIFEDLARPDLDLVIHCEAVYEPTAEAFFGGLNRQSFDAVFSGLREPERAFAGTVACDMMLRTQRGATLAEFLVARGHEMDSGPAPSL